MGTVGGPGINFPDVAPAVKDVFNYSFAGCQYCNPAASHPIGDSTGNSGFPVGFNPSAAQSLGYVAAMQEAGVPVTFTYIADAHDNHAAGQAYGPGQAGYVQQLAAENTAYQAFFERLGHDGITKQNTLFVFTVDEGDHFAGGPPTNAATCNGVTIACTYTAGTSGPNTIGEQDTFLNDAFARERNDTNAFDIHSDDAPTFAVHGAPGSTAPPGPNDPAVRAVEQDASKLTLVSPRTGATDTVMQHIADQQDESILHMVNADPLRTPTFTLFGNPDYFFQTGTCPAGTTPGCPAVGPSFAWNHGDDNPQIAQTWVGYVGPTIANLGQTGAVWTDHTDVRPTMLAALGLSDDYTDDGRVVSNVFDAAALPSAMASRHGDYDNLAAAYKQLDAPFGQFGADSEVVSTTAASSSSPGDSVYQGFDAQLNACEVQRNPIAGEMRDLLNGAAFGGESFSHGTAVSLVNRAHELISDMHELAGTSTPPSHLLCGPAASAS
jgi:hypothetical protein